VSPVPRANPSKLGDRPDMNLYKDATVRSDWGPRPAGQPDECFYCREAVGDAHKADCVCLRKAVVLKYEVLMVVSVPQSWTKKDIEFHRNDSSWCFSNDIEQLHAEVTHEKSRCNICHRASATFVREATEDDIDYLRPDGMEFSE